MPKNPQTVSDEDIRRKYYESAGYSMWITEMQLDPLQLVVADDSTGKKFRVPVDLSGGVFTFGDPVEVAVQYVDAPAKAARSAIVFASRDASLDGVTPNPGLEQIKAADDAKHGRITPAEAAARIHAASTAATKTPATADPAGGPTHPEGAVTMPFDRIKMLEALGLGPDATQQQIDEAWATANAVTPPTTETVPATEPVAASATDMPLSALAQLADKLGVKMIDPGQLQQMQEMAARGQAAYDAQRRNERDGEIDKALKQGKIALSRKPHWEKSWDADPEGTRAMLAGLSPNMVPMEADGYANAVATSETEQRYYGMYPEDQPGRKGGGR